MIKIYLDKNDKNNKMIVVCLHLIYCYNGDQQFLSTFYLYKQEIFPV